MHDESTGKIDVWRGGKVTSEWQRLDGALYDVLRRVLGNALGEMAAPRVRNGRESREVVTIDT